MQKKYGPVGMIHVDAHADINDTMFGEKIAHGTPFRRAVEERPARRRRWRPDRPARHRLCRRGFRLAARQGFRVVQAEECWHQSLAPLMREVSGRWARPGLPELRHRQARPRLRARHRHARDRRPHHHPGLEIIRGCQGLDLVGCDLVEVSPPYDPSGNTALVGANLLFEMLCVLPGVKRR